MVVSLIVSSTLNGAQYSDALVSATPAAQGADLGKVASGGYTPLIDQTNNQGFLPLYIRHDGINEISNLSVYLQQFGLGTSYAYGGDDSAANDYSNLLAFGTASGSSKNNANGLSSGLWIDMDADASDSTRFDVSTRPTEVKIFKTGEGDSLTAAFLIKNVAMVFDSGGETQAGAPIDGKVGASGDGALGDNAHINTRLYVATSFLDSGLFQWEKVFTYSFTS